MDELSVHVALAVEKNYSQPDKEGIGIISGVKKNPLVHAWSDFQDCYRSQATRQSFQPDKPYSQDLATKNHQVGLLMSSYDYSIMYKPGTITVAADAMSRLPLQENL